MSESCCITWQHLFCSCYCNSCSNIWLKALLLLLLLHTRSLSTGQEDTLYHHEKCPRVMYKCLTRAGFGHEFMLECVALLLCCRFLAGNSVVPPLSGQTLSLSPDLVDSFVPTPPPNLSKLINLHQSPRERKASPSSLPGRLSRALSLGTIPSLSRTGICEILLTGWDDRSPNCLAVLKVVIVSFSDSGFLFSGSRPASLYKESPSSGI